jgi:hypothetical protein
MTNSPGTQVCRDEIANLKLAEKKARAELDFTYADDLAEIIAAAEHGVALQAFADG